jgi:hypothetical protein
MNEYPINNGAADASPKALSRARWVRGAIRVTGLMLLAVGLLAARPPDAGAVPCPTGGAKVDLCVTNPTNATTPLITLSGQYVANEYTCMGPPPITSQYSTSFTVGPNQKYCPGAIPANGLVTGMYLHHISVAATGQSQYQQSPMLYPVTRVEWTYFPNVVTVNQTGDGGACADSCTTNCTFRQAINRANTLSGGASAPVLIQFTVSPGAMRTTNPCVLQIAGNGSITIDGVDSNGKPWIVGDPNATTDVPPRLVDLNNGNFMSIASSNNTVQGLDIKNTVAAGQRQAGDLITIPAGKTNNQVIACRINGGNADAGVNCSGGVCDSNTSDLFEVLGGTSFAAPAVTIRKVEGHSGIDKGIKANGSSGGGYAVVRDSWIHNNYRGGIQATLNSHIKLDRNTEEEAGFRGTDKVQMDNAANGLVANGGTSTSQFNQLLMNGNISRNNVQHGLAANAGYATTTSQNDYLCGDGINGFASGGSGYSHQTVSGTGTAAVYNQLRGVALTGFDSANFGDQVANPGNNAFSQNVNCDFQNTGPSAVNARNSQWQDGVPRICSGGAGVNYNPTQSGPNELMFINADIPTIPSNVFLQGQTVRIYGHGFNAIAGNPLNGCVQGIGDLTTNPPTSCCRQKAKANVCDPNTPHSPLSGNCVEFQRTSLDGGSSDEAAVTSVTPATIVTETDATICMGNSGELVWVSKQRGDGSLDQQNASYCNNANTY